MFFLYGSCGSGGWWRGGVVAEAGAAGPEKFYGAVGCKGWWRGGGAAAMYRWVVAGWRRSRHAPEDGGGITAQSRKSWRDSGAWRRNRRALQGIARVVGEIAGRGSSADTSIILRRND